MLSVVSEFLSFLVFASLFLFKKSSASYEGDCLCHRKELMEQGI